MADEFSFEIIKNYGTLSTSKSGWSLELNFVSWNGRDPKFDIRSWAPDHKKMGKGVAFSNEEILKLKELLNELNVE